MTQVTSCDLKILHRREAAQGEEVAASADVSGLRPLSVGEVGETMFDTNALADLLAPYARVKAGPEPLLQRFIVAQLQRPKTNRRGLSLRNTARLREFAFPPNPESQWSRWDTV